MLNVYCDESCHLENDGKPVMLLGAIWAPKDQVKRLSEELKQIKHRYKACGELKWTKVSNSRLNFFIAVLDWFFLQPDLCFRSLVVANKQDLDHISFNQGSHDDFYYKMYFSLLSKILSPNFKYGIYLDIKDTRSRFKLNTLKDVLCNDKYDFTGQMIEQMQHVRSDAVVLLQLADLLLGAISYKHRNRTTSEAKLEFVKHLEKLSGKSLLKSTLLYEQKFNLFIWTPHKKSVPHV